RDGLFQLLPLLDVSMGLPKGDRTLARQRGDGLGTFLELPQQLASTIEPLSLFEHRWRAASVIKIKLYTASVNPYSISAGTAAAAQTRSYLLRKGCRFAVAQ